MLLKADALLEDLNAELLKRRSSLAKRPTLALVWVGDDVQTARFVAVKKRRAKELDCDFDLRHFSSIDERHLAALIEGLNKNKQVDGIVLQLPLPKNLLADRFIKLINPEKDVDGLVIDSCFEEPTPTGIVTLLEHHGINPGTSKSVIIGAGRLVGRPLMRMFDERGWRYLSITENAKQRVSEIQQCDLLISCTGVPHLITPDMVHENMVVIDGSGVDVDVKQLEPLVKAVTPTRGTIGPLTVHFLFSNLLTAAGG